MQSFKYRMYLILATNISDFSIKHSSSYNMTELRKKQSEQPDRMSFPSISASSFLPPEKENLASISDSQTLAWIRIICRTGET